MMRGPTLRFLVGMLVGFVIAYLNRSFVAAPTRREIACDCPLYIDTPRRITREQGTIGNLTVEQKEVKEEPPAYKDDETLIRDHIGSIRLLCWTMTRPENLETRAKYIQSTWARRCDLHIFISSETNASFPTVGIDVKEGRDHLTEKTMQGFEYIYKNHFDDADWFLKTDDDAYVIVENLRYFLSSQKTEEPIYFGHHFKTIVEQGYISGGPGIVVSKEAMRRFGENGNSSNQCRDMQGSSGDARFGICMQNLEVRIGDSRDKFGRSRFHCFSPETHLRGTYPQWYYTYDANGANWGKDSMSDYAIAFHYVSSEIYTLDYLLYHLSPYGIDYPHQDINKNNVHQREEIDDKHQAIKKFDVDENEGIGAEYLDINQNKVIERDRIDDEINQNNEKQKERIDYVPDINQNSIDEKEGIDDGHLDINQNEVIERNGIDYVVEDDYINQNIVDKKDTFVYEY